MQDSEEKLLERYMELQHELGFYEQVVGRLDAIVLILDVITPRLVFVNESYSEVTGYQTTTDKDITFEDIHQVYHPDDQSFFTQMQNYLLNNPNKTYSLFYRLRHADGHYIWLYTVCRVYKLDLQRDIFEILSVSLDFSGPINFERNLKPFTRDKLREINRSALNRISKREKEVLQLFARGLTTPEVAEKLDISFHTVNNHRKNMLKKLDLKNLAALVTFAVEHGLD